jgi:5-carboxymethyl-2-hydroxymuconate isomerase
MAHFIYEYSSNLPGELLNLPSLMAKMHRAAAETGVFPESGMRSRAIRCEEFYLADGDPTRGFLNLSMKVGGGRDKETRRQCGELLFDTLIEHLQALMEQMPLAVSYEMRELDELVKFNRKNY